MNFRHLSLMLRLSLAALFCSLLYFGGNFPPDDYFASPDEVTIAFDELGDDKSFEKSFDVGIQGVIFEGSLNQHSDWVSLNLGYKSGATLELHATGPPNV